MPKMPDLSKVPGLSKIPGLSQGKAPKGAVVAVIAVVGLLVIGGIGKMIVGKMASFAARKAIEAGTGVSIDAKGDVTRVKTGEGVLEVKKSGEGAGTMTVTGKDGQTSQVQFAGGDGKAVALPSAFPSDFPLLSGAQPTGSFAATEGTTQTFTVSWDSSGSIADAKDFYSKELVAKGWRITGTSEIEGSVMLVFERGPADAEKKDGGWISISTEEGKTKITTMLSINSK
jgi:hypothetical protein